MFTIQTCSANKIYDFVEKKSDLAISGGVVKGSLLREVSEGKKEKRLVFSDECGCSIAFKDDGAFFIPKFLYKKFVVEVKEGDETVKKTVYININSLLKRTGLKREQLNQYHSLSKIMEDTKEYRQRQLDFSQKNYKPHEKEFANKLGAISRMEGLNFRVSKLSKVFDHAVEFLCGQVYKSTPWVLGKGSYKQAKLAQHGNDEVARLCSKAGKEITRSKVLEEYENTNQFKGCPGIAQIDDCFEYKDKKGNDKFIFYMKKYRSDLTRDLVRLQKEPESKKKIARQLLQGLAAISRKGIHYDLKPDNILLDEENNPHITDFGFYLAKDKPFEAKGTPRYASPEIWKSVPGKAEPREPSKTDVWSMGLVLAELYGFKLPWRNQPKPGWTIMNLGKNWLHHFNIPGEPGLTNLIKGMLKVNPEERFTAQQALDKFGEI